MREEPIRVNGVDYNSPNALDLARQSGQINPVDYELAQREVGERAARRIVAHGASTFDLINLRTARPSLNAIPDAQLPSLLTPEYMRSLRGGGGIGGELTATSGAGVKGGGAGGMIAVVTTAGVMLFDEADHPNWERELGTAGTLGILGGTAGSTTEQLLISRGTRHLLDKTAASSGGTLLTRGMVTTGGRFGGGGLGAGVVELASMGFFEDRSHSGLEYTARTTRAFVIGGASAVIGAEAGAGAAVLTSALIGAGAGSGAPIVGNIVGFIVGLGVGAFVYYVADKAIPGGRADWDAAEAARQEGCQRRATTRPGSTPDDLSELRFHCIAHDMQILMSDGSTMAIQHVQIGHYVLGYDVSTQRTIAAPVTRAVNHGRSPCLRIVLDNGAELRLTADHPVALSIGACVRWVKAGSLMIGQQVLIGNDLDRPIVLQSIAIIEPMDREQDVYDLNIDSVHNFFAGGILVHNKWF
jgi:hypothetical protein